MKSDSYKGRHQNIKLFLFFVLSNSSISGLSRSFGIYECTYNCILKIKILKKLENFGGHLLSEDDHLYWAPPYWNITKETFLWEEMNHKYNCKNCQLRVWGMFIKK